MALTNQELKDMEAGLKKAFTQAAERMERADNMGLRLASTTALALTIQAQLSVDAEIRRRGFDSGRKPGDM